MFVVSMLFCVSISSHEISQTSTLFFRQGSSLFDVSIEENRRFANQIGELLQQPENDSIYQIVDIDIVSSSSPEGSSSINQRLSEKRANAIVNYLSRYNRYPIVKKNLVFIGRDWKGLYKLVESDADTPNQIEVLQLLKPFLSNTPPNKQEEDLLFQELKRLNSGIPYRYLNKTFFPKLRASHVSLTLKRIRLFESRKFYKVAAFNEVDMSLPTNDENVVCDSAMIQFKVNKHDLNLNLGQNEQILKQITNRLQNTYADSIYQVEKIVLMGAASPEGSIAINKKLSENRAKTLLQYLSTYTSLPDSLTTAVFVGRDWNKLYKKVQEDKRIPYREDVLDLLANYLSMESKEIQSEDVLLSKLKQLHGGQPYYYLFKHIFPELRASQIYFWFKKVKNPEYIAPPTVLEIKDPPIIPDTIVEPPVVEVKIDTPVVEIPKKPFYMALKTNMLYDALLVPNIGVEFYLGKKWSIAANWMYAWWKNDRTHYYWRTYGGDLEIRRWIGKKSTQKPLTGHHLGAYVQMVTYDFEWGSRGYLGDRWSYAGGISYGYSHPIGKRLNIDFTVGIGYLGGEYKEYLPIDNCYVWQATKQRHWFGPTKAEISLVWLLGRGNYNVMKGGKR